MDLSLMNDSTDSNERHNTRSNVATRLTAGDHAPATVLPFTRVNETLMAASFVYEIRCASLAQRMFRLIDDVLTPSAHPIPAAPMKLAQG